MSALASALGTPGVSPAPTVSIVRVSFMRWPAPPPWLVDAVQLHPPILLTSRRGLVAGDRLVGPEPLGGELGRRDTVGLEEALDRLRSRRREPHVRGPRAGMVGVAGYLDPHIGVGCERMGHVLEDRLARIGQLRLTGGEGHALQDDGALGALEQFGAALLVHCLPVGRAGADIHPVGNSVGIAVARASASVHRLAGRGIGGGVDVVHHAVLIAIELPDGAAIVIRPLTGRRVGALVQVVVDTVGIAVGLAGGAARGVHRLTGRSVEALVEVIDDPVVVLVLLLRGAAFGIDLGAGRGIGTAIRTVLHAVLVGVPLAGGAAVAINLRPGGSAGAAVVVVLHPVLVVVVAVAEEKHYAALHSPVLVIVRGNRRGAGDIVDGPVHLQGELLAQPEAQAEEPGRSVVIEVHVLPEHVAHVPGPDADGAGIAAQRDVVGQPAANGGIVDVE